MNVKLILFLITNFILRMCFGQSLNGIIEYAEKTKLNISFPEGFTPPANLPKENTRKKVLYFSSDESLYTNAQTKQASEFSSSEARGEGEFQFTFKMEDPRQDLYKQLKNNLSIESRDFFGRDFLIKGELTPYAWKVSQETKSIAGYTCMKATTIVKDTLDVTAWFTVQLPVSTGPAQYGSLPGLILEVEIPKLNQTITATAVNLMDAAPKEIVLPSKGKAVTKEQFEKIQADKMAEMQAEYGGSGNVIIRTIKN